MRKISTVLVAAAGLMLASMSFAAPNAENVQNGYFTKMGSSQKIKNDSKNLRFPPTTITLINGSINIVHLMVDGTTIDDVVQPTVNDHIYNRNGAFNTSITLRDPYYGFIWSGVVCPRALVSVFGQPGRYHVNIDEEYCY